MTLMKNLVYGAIYGDSISAPSARHRVAILAPKRRLRMRTLDEFSDDHFQTTRPTPYTHAQRGHLLNPAPSDDSEWMLFSALAAKKQQSVDSWKKLANSDETIFARTGTKIALKNLKDGKDQEISGVDNPHYFDDISLIRALGVFIATRSHKAVKTDISITHSEDGLWCAQAIAVLLESILNKQSRSDAVNKAISILPENSWSKRKANEALQLAKNSSNQVEFIFKVENGYLDRIYAYGVSAPETLGLLFGHILLAENGYDLFSSSLFHKRQLDTLPAICGLFAVALFDELWLPTDFINQDIELDGVCINEMKSKKISEILTQLEA